MNFSLHVIYEFPNQINDLHDFKNTFQLLLEVYS